MSVPTPDVGAALRAVLMENCIALRKAHVLISMECGRRSPYPLHQTIERCDCEVALYYRGYMARYQELSNARPKP